MRRLRNQRRSGQYRDLGDGQRDRIGGIAVLVVGTGIKDVQLRHAGVGALVLPQNEHAPIGTDGDLRPNRALGAAGQRCLVDQRVEVRIQQFVVDFIAAAFTPCDVAVAGRIDRDVCPCGLENTVRDLLAHQTGVGDQGIQVGIDLTAVADAVAVGIANRRVGSVGIDLIAITQSIVVTIRIARIRQVLELPEVAKSIIVVVRPGIRRIVRIQSKSVFVEIGDTIVICIREGPVLDLGDVHRCHAVELRDVGQPGQIFSSRLGSRGVGFHGVESHIHERFAGRDGHVLPLPSVRINRRSDDQIDGVAARIPPGMGQWADRWYGDTPSPSPVVVSHRSARSNTASLLELASTAKLFCTVTLDRIRTVTVMSPAVSFCRMFRLLTQFEDCGM